MEVGWLQQPWVTRECWGKRCLCNGELVTADVVRHGSGPSWSVFVDELCVVPAGLVHLSAVFCLLSIPYSQKRNTSHTFTQGFSSITQSCLTLCNPTDCSRPSLPVHHQLPELVQTHFHWVGDAIQPSHPLLSPCPPALNQGLFQGVSSSHQVAKVLEVQLQRQSFQWIFRADFLQDGLVGSPCDPRDSQESSPTPQFKSINSSALSFLYRCKVHYPQMDP